MLIAQVATNAKVEHHRYRILPLIGRCESVELRLYFE